MAARKKSKPKGRQRTQTAAVARLQDWLTRPGNSQAALAIRIGVSQACIAQWKSAYSRPTHKWRIALERVMGIPAVEWMTARERDEAAGAIRKAG